MALPRAARIGEIGQLYLLHPQLARQPCAQRARQFIKVAGFRRDDHVGHWLLLRRVD